MAEEGATCLLAGPKQKKLRRKDALCDFLVVYPKNGTMFDHLLALNTMRYRARRLLIDSSVLPSIAIFVWCTTR
jgi:hypothetical protein